MKRGYGVLAAVEVVLELICEEAHERLDLDVLVELHVVLVVVRVAVEQTHHDGHGLFDHQLQVALAVLFSQLLQVLQLDQVVVDELEELGLEDEVLVLFVRALDRLGEEVEHLREHLLHFLVDELLQRAEEHHRLGQEVDVFEVASLFAHLRLQLEVVSFAEQLEEAEHLGVLFGQVSDFSRLDCDLFEVLKLLVHEHDFDSVVASVLADQVELRAVESDDVVDAREEVAFAVCLDDFEELHLDRLVASAEQRDEQVDDLDLYLLVVDRTEDLAKAGNDVLLDQLDLPLAQVRFVVVWPSSLSITCGSVGAVFVFDHAVKVVVQQFDAEGEYSGCDFGDLIALRERVQETRSDGFDREGGL